MAHEDVFYMTKLKIEANEDGITEACCREYYDYMAKHIPEPLMKFTINELLNTLINAQKDNLEKSINAISMVYENIGVADYVKFIEIVRKLRLNKGLEREDLAALNGFAFENPFVQLAVEACLLHYYLENDGNNVELLKKHVALMEQLQESLKQYDESKSGRGFHVDSF